MSPEHRVCNDIMYRHKASLSVAFSHVICWLSRWWSVDVNADTGHTLLRDVPHLPPIYRHPSARFCSNSADICMPRFLTPFSASFPEKNATVQPPVPLYLKQSPTHSLLLVLTCPIIVCFVQNWCLMCAVNGAVLLLPHQVVTELSNARRAQARRNSY